MIFKSYRDVLSLPGVRALMFAALLARVPIAATAVTVTLYVLQDLHLGYGAAGGVATAMTVGIALGGPLLGRLMDRYGLRPVLTLAALGEALFWAVAPTLRWYPALLGFTVVTCLLKLPISPVIRQSVAALVPPERRRTAYAIDSMVVELSFMTGPVLAVLGVTLWTARVTMYLVGGAIVLAGLAIVALNPPVRAAHEDLPGRAPASRVRGWLDRPMLAQFAIVTTATLVLSGTEMGLVAELRAVGQVGWTGTVVAVWSAASLVGGFVFGAVRRQPSPVVLVGVMALVTIPIGFATGWYWLSLAVVPAGTLCAPALAASTHTVSRLAPPSARGEVMGWHASATTLGFSLGAPAVGAVIDRWGPAVGFAAVGVVGLAVAVGLAPLAHRPPGTVSEQGPGVPLEMSSRS